MGQHALDDCIPPAIEIAKLAKIPGGEALKDRTALIPASTRDIGTPIGREDTGSRKAEYDFISLHRIGRPEEVAEAAVFFASAKASYIATRFLRWTAGGSIR